MKKMSVFVMFTAIMLAVSALAVAQTPDTRWFDNAKAEKDTFWISTAEELAGLAKIVNDLDKGNDFRGKTIVLVKDIDLTEWGYWEQIGRRFLSPTNKDNDIKRPFSGIFDGNGKTVTGLRTDVYTTNNRFFIGLFGYLVDGTVKNIGVVDVRIDGDFYVGAVVGQLIGGTVENCYSSGGSILVAQGGGVVGRVDGGTVTNCYSSVRVYVSSIISTGGGVVGILAGGGRVINGYSTGGVGSDPVYDGPGYGYSKTPVEIGGVVGLVEDGIVSNCYSTGDVRGYSEIGGVVGRLVTGDVKNCIALNPIVNSMQQGGRVIGSVGTDKGDYKHTDNFAFKGIKGTFPAVKGPSTINGADITLEKILSDSTLDKNFTKENGWTLEKGKLPGLQGKSVDIPDHLFRTDAIASPSREIPAISVSGDNPSETVVAVAPLNNRTPEFSLGPNPVIKSDCAVNFYFQGKRIKSGALAVYDASGNIVGRIGIAGEASSNPANVGKRLIATWDLRNKSGRPVSRGAYSVRGTVTTVDGETERVSVVVGVR
jgi:hypothetical protein